jgi:acetyl-CoA carboxylase alpha subunit
MNESHQSEKGLVQLVQHIKELNYKRHRADIETATTAMVELADLPVKKRRIMPRYSVSGYEKYKVSRHGKRPYCIVYLLDWFISKNDRVIWRVEEVDQDDDDSYDESEWKDSVWKEEEKNLLKA